MSLCKDYLQVSLWTKTLFDKLQVTVKYPIGIQKVHFDPISASSVGKFLAAGIANHTVQDLRIRAHIVTSIKEVCKNEIKGLRLKSLSLQSRKKDLSLICHVRGEPKQKAPYLSSLLYNKQELLALVSPFLVKVHQKFALHKNDTGTQGT